MANPHNGEVAITLADGKAYVLHYGINALCALESELGLDIKQVSKLLNGQVQMTTVRAMLFAGLQDHHGDELRDSKSIGPLMKLADLAVYAGKIGEAFRLAFPQAGGASGEAPPPKLAPKAPKTKARAGTGKRS